MRLRDKVTIVTGGSSGIGKSISRRFAAEGAIVAIVARDRVRIDTVVDEIASDGGRAYAFPADLARPQACAALIAEVVGQLGAVDVLVNNAGLFQPCPIGDTTEDVWDAQIAVNLKAPFFLSKAAIGQMRKQGGGKIINVTSIGGIGGFPNSAAYCASKGGLVNMTKALCLKVARDGINVNALAPGNVKTGMNAALRETEDYDAHNASLTPNGVGHLEPNDMTGAAVFLASEDTNAVHGVNLLVDGGWAAW